MKTRVLSAFIMAIIVIPIFLSGGLIYNLAVLLIGLLGMKEYLNIRESKKEFLIL